jgi:hypothetical protein
MPAIPLWVWALVPFFVGWLHWHYNRGPRATVWLIGFGFFLLAVGVPIWTDTLAATTASGTGFGLLLVILIVFGVAGVWEGVHKPRTKPRKDGVVPTEPKHHYSHVRTVGVFAVLGTAAAVGVMRRSALGAAAKHSPASIGAGIKAATTQVSDGHAAAAAGSATHKIVWVVALLGFGAFMYYLHKVEKRRRNNESASIFAGGLAGGAPARGRQARAGRVSRRDKRAAKRQQRGRFGTPVTRGSRGGQGSIPTGAPGMLPIGRGEQ